MATRKSTKTLHLLYLVEELPPEVQKLLPSNLKEIQNYEHPLVLNTLQQMRDTEKTFFDLDTIFPCVLTFLLLDQIKRKYEKEAQDELQAILDSTLVKEPDNLIALCIKQKIKKTKATKEKIDKLVAQPNILNQAYASVAFYLSQLNLTKASVKLFEQSIAVWEQNGKGNDVKIIIWKLLLAEAYSHLLSRKVFNDISDTRPDSTMIRVHELLQSGIALEKKQDKPLQYIAARCYIVLALTYSEYEKIQQQNGRQEDLCITVDVKQCYEEAQKLCDGQDPYVMQYYGLYLKETANNPESLRQAVDILEPLLRICPQRHMVAHQLALTYEALWITEKQMHNLNDDTRPGVEKQQEPNSGKNRQEFRHQKAGESDTEYERINNESNETLECAEGGSRLSSSETLEGAARSDNITSSETLQGAVTGSNLLISEKLEGTIRGSNLSNSEALKGVVGSANVSSSEALQGAVKSDLSTSEALQGTVGIDLSTSEALQGAVGSDNLSSNEALQGAVGSDLSTSEVLQGAVGSDLSTSEVLQGVVGSDLSSNEALQGVVGSDNLSSSEALQGAVGSDLSNSEALRGTVGGSNLSRSQNLHTNLEGKDPPMKDIWNVLKWLVEENMPQHAVDTIQRSAEKLTETQVSKKSISHNLALAQQYFIMANKGANGRCVVYLVDLARVLASCGETDSAVRYFDNARCVLSSHFLITNHQDTAYLYEQWALMLMRQLESEKHLENLQHNLGCVQKELENKVKEVHFLKQFEKMVRQRTNIMKWRKKLEERYEGMHKRWEDLGKQMENFMIQSEHKKAQMAHILQQMADNWNQNNMAIIEKQYKILKDNQEWTSRYIQFAYAVHQWLNKVKQWSFKVKQWKDILKQWEDIVEQHVDILQGYIYMVEQYKKNTAPWEEMVKQWKDILEQWEDIVVQTEDLMEQSEDMVEQSEGIQAQLEELEEQGGNIDKQLEDIVKQSENREEQLEDIKEQSNNIVKQLEDMVGKSEDIVEKSEEIVEQFEGKVEQSEDRVKQLGDTVEQLGDIVKQSEDRVDQSEDSVKQLGKTVVQSEDRVKQLGNIVEQLGDIVEQSEDIVEQSEDRVEQSEDRVEQSEDIMEQSEDSVKQLGGTVEQLGNIVKQSEDREDQSEDIVKQLGDTVEQSEDRMEQSEHIMEQSEARVDQSEDIVNQSEDRVDQSEDRVGQPEDTMKQLGDTVEQSEDRVKQSEDRVEQSEHIMEQSEDRVKQSEDRVDQSEDRVGQSEDRVGQPGDTMKQLGDTVEQSEDRVKQSEDRVEQSEHIMEQSEDRVMQSAHTMEQSEDRVKQSGDRVDQSEDRVGQSEDRVGQPEDTMKQLGDTVEQSEDRVKQSEDRAEQSEHIMEQSKDRVKQSEHIMEQSEDRVMLSEERVEQSEDIVKQLGDTVEQSEDRVEQSEHIMEQSEDRVKQSEDRVEQSEDRMKWSKDQVAQLEDRVEQLRDKVKLSDNIVEQSDDKTEQGEDKVKLPAEDIAARSENLMEQSEDDMEQSENIREQSEDKVELSYDIVEQSELECIREEGAYLIHQTEHLGQKIPEDIEKEHEGTERIKETIGELFENIKQRTHITQRVIKEHVKNFEHKMEMCNPSISKEDIRENLEDILKHHAEKAAGEVDQFIAKIEDILRELEDLDDVTTSDISDIDDYGGEVQQLNRIECYFLKSIRSAVKVKSNPRLAFHKLTEMLESDLQNDRSSQKWLVLCELFQLAGQYEKAQRLLENNDMTTSKARRLFKQQCIQNQEFGKFLDLAYAIYHSTPDDLIKHDIVEMTMRKMRPDTEAGAVDNEGFKAYGDALKVFVKEPIPNQANSAQNNCASDGSGDTSFLVFMARPENTETGGFKYIVENLQRCGVHIKRYLKRSIDDFDFGCNTRVEIQKTIEVCQLIFVSDLKDSCPMGDSLPPVGFIIQYVEEYGCNIPVFILHETDDPPAEEWKKLHHLDIREADNDAKFHVFMTELFQNICPPKCSICKNTVRKITSTA